MTVHLARSRLRGAWERGRPAWRLELAPLAHPLWWAALAVLLVNDNLLKGSGIVPGWLTGKLSDFAFLIVAPVVCASLLPVVVPGRRAIAMGSVIGLFVVTDLSPAASDAVVAAAAHLGLRWRLWPDPTDLMALAVLPWTVRILRVRSRSASADRGGIAVRSRIGLVVGSLACLATSAPPRYTHRPFFLNKTEQTVDLRVTWVLSKVDCAMPPRALAETLGPGDLDDPVTHAVASGQVAVLDGPQPSGTTPVGLCHLTSTFSSNDLGRCVAAVLESEGAQPVLMVAQAMWTESASGDMFSCSSSDPPESKCRANLGRNADPGRDAVTLAGSAGGHAFDGNRAEPGGEDAWRFVTIADVDLDAITMRAPADDSCRATRERYRALLDLTACASDAECVALDAVPIPGDEDACTVYLNTGVQADELRELRTAWVARCTAAADWCPSRQPAVCNAGSCGAACPGVVIPTCPPRCDPGDDYSADCTRYTSCLNEAGEVCNCNDTPACRPMPPAAPSCSLACLPREHPDPSGAAGSMADDDAGFDG